MDKVYISWSIENWITVVLMVALGYFVVSAVTSVVRSKMGGGSILGQAVPGTPLTGSQQAGSLASGG